MKKQTIIIIGILLIANKASANPLQINEARLELSRIQYSKAEARSTLNKAELAYKALRTAANKQEHALELLIKADQAKQLAERNSGISVDNGKSASQYFADQGHSTGTALLIEKPQYQELEGYQRGS